MAPPQTRLRVCALVLAFASLLPTLALAQSQYFLNYAITASSTCSASDELCSVTGADSQSTIQCGITPCLENTIQEAVDFESQFIVDAWWSTPGVNDVVIEIDPDQTCSGASRSDNFTWIGGYFAINFASRRPQHMVVERTIDNGATWEPWRYYAHDCMAEFGVAPSSSFGGCIESVNLASPQLEVVSLFSFPGLGIVDPIALLDPSVVAPRRFQRLRLRLFDYTRAPSDPIVEDQYSYSVNEVEVVAICDCNYHADDCVQQDCNAGILESSCVCGNNTVGRNCEACAQGFQDHPWVNGLTAPCEACTCLPGSSLPVADPTSASASCRDDNGDCFCAHATVTGSDCDTCVDGFYAAWYDVLAAQAEDGPLASGSKYVVFDEGTWWTGRGYVRLDAGEGLSFDAATADSGYTHVLEMTVSGAASIMVNGDSYSFSSTTFARITLASASAAVSVVVGGPVLVDRIVSVEDSFLRDPKFPAAQYPDFPRYAELNALVPDTCDVFNTNADDASACRELAFAQSIADNGECFDCDCDPRGTVDNTECDPYGGQCECLENVVGRRCDECALEFYFAGGAGDGCLPCGCSAGFTDVDTCGCNAIGSVDGFCGADGQCICREFFTGPRCDRCIDEAVYDEVNQVCVYCPDCVRELEAKLTCDNTAASQLAALLPWHNEVLVNIVDVDERLAALSLATQVRDMAYTLIDKETLNITEEVAAVILSFDSVVIEALNVTVRVLNRDVVEFVNDISVTEQIVQEYARAVIVYYEAWLATFQFVVDVYNDEAPAIYEGLVTEIQSLATSFGAHISVLRGACLNGQATVSGLLLQLDTVNSIALRLSEIDIEPIIAQLGVAESIRIDLRQRLDSLRSMTETAASLTTLLENIRLAVASTAQSITVTITSVDSIIDEINRLLALCMAAIDSIESTLDSWVSSSGYLTLLRALNTDAASLLTTSTTNARNAETHSQGIVDGFAEMDNIVTSTVRDPNIPVLVQDFMDVIGRIAAIQNRSPSLGGLADQVTSGYSQLDLTFSEDAINRLRAALSTHLDVLRAYYPEIEDIADLQASLSSILDLSNFLSVPTVVIEGRLSQLAADLSAIRGVIVSHDGALAVREAVDLVTLFDLLASRVASMTSEASSGLSSATGLVESIQGATEGVVDVLEPGLRASLSGAVGVSSTISATTSGIAATSSLIDGVEARLAMLAITPELTLARRPVVRPIFSGDALFSSPLDIDLAMSGNEVSYTTFARNLGVTTGVGSEGDTLDVSLYAAGVAIPLVSPLPFDPSTLLSVPFASSSISIISGVALSVRAWRLAPFNDLNSLYPSNEEVFIAVQALDTSATPVSDEVELFVRVVNRVSGNGVGGSCLSSTDGSGTCLVSLKVPDAWLSSQASYDVDFYAALSEDDLATASPFHDVTFSPVPSLLTVATEVALEFPVHTLTEGEEFVANIRSLWDRAVASFVVRVTLPSNIELLETVLNDVFNVETLASTGSQGEQILVITGIRKEVIVGNTNPSGSPVINELVATLSLRLSAPYDAMGTRHEVGVHVYELTYITGRTLRDVPKPGLITTTSGYVASPQPLRATSAGATVLIPVLSSGDLLDIQPVSDGPPSVTVRLVGFNGLGSVVGPEGLTCTPTVSSGITCDSTGLDYPEPQFQITATNAVQAAASGGRVLFGAVDNRGSRAFSIVDVGVSHITSLRVVGDIECISPVTSSALNDLEFSESVELGIVAVLNDGSSIDLTAQAIEYGAFASADGLLMFTRNVARLVDPGRPFIGFPATASVVLSRPVPGHVSMAPLVIDINVPARPVSLNLQGINPEDLAIEVRSGGNGETTDAVRRTAPATYTIRYFTTPTLRRGGVSFAVVVGRVVLDDGRVETLSTGDLVLTTAGFSYDSASGVLRASSGTAVGDHVLTFEWRACCNANGAVTLLTGTLDVSVVDLSGVLVTDRLIHMAVFGDPAVSAGALREYIPIGTAEYTTLVPGRIISMDVSPTFVNSDVIVIPSNNGLTLSSSSSGVIVIATTTGDKNLTLVYYSLSGDVDINVVRFDAFDLYYVPFPHPELTTAASQADISLLDSLRVPQPHFCRLPETTSVAQHVQGQLVVKIRLDNGTEVLVSPGEYAPDVQIEHTTSALTVQLVSRRNDNNGDLLPYRHIAFPQRNGIATIGVTYSSEADGVRARVSDSAASVTALVCGIDSPFRITCSIEFTCTGPGTQSRYLYDGSAVGATGNANIATMIALEDYVSFSVDSFQFGDALVIDPKTGDITPLRNTPVELDIVSSFVNDSSISTRSRFGANLVAEPFDVDLGGDGYVAIPPVTDGATFEVPVRVNTDGVILGSFDIVVDFDPVFFSALDVLAPINHLILQTSIGSSSVRLVGYSSSTNGLVGTIVFSAANAGPEDQIAFISAYINVLTTTSFSTVIEYVPAVAGNVPVLIRPNARRRSVDTAAFSIDSVPVAPARVRRELADPIDCTYFEFHVLESCPDPVMCDRWISGDVDGDCAVTALDVAIIFALLQQQVVDFDTSLGEGLLQLMSSVDLEAHADVDGSNVVTTTDARLLVAALAGNNALLSFNSTFDGTSLLATATVESTLEPSVDIAMYAFISSPCASLFDIDRAATNAIRVFTAEQNSIRNGEPVQPLYTYVIRMSAVSETEFTLTVSDDSFIDLSRVGLSFYQIASNNQAFFFNDERALDYYSRFSVRVTPFGSAVALFVDGHTPVFNYRSSALSSLDGSYTDTIPNFRLQSVAYVTSATTVLTSQLVGGSKECAAADCANSCANAGRACAGFFVEVTDSTLEALCLLLSDLVTPANGASPGPNDAAYARNDIAEEPFTPENYDLVFVGDVPSNTGEPLRFSTAFSASAVIANVANITLQECAQLCDADAACIGFVFFNSVFDQCNLLQSIGTAAGISTGTYSFSYAKNLDLVSVAGYELTFVGFTPYASSAVPLRFETAFNGGVTLARSGADLLRCGAACDENAACLGFAYLLSSSTPCRLLSALGDPAGVATTSSTLSFSKLNVFVVPEGFTLEASNSGGGSGGLRFSTGFSSSAVLSRATVLSGAECASICVDETGCVGFFMYLRSSDEVWRCHTLNSVGTLVSTSQVSYSLSRDVVIPSVAGYTLDLVADGGATSSSLRYSTAFSSGAQISKSTVASAEACGAVCDGESALGSFCVGFFVYPVSGGLRCVTLRDLGSALPTSMSGYSFSAISPVLKLGFSVTFSGVPRRFSTAFSGSAQIGGVTTIEAGDLDSASLACGLQCVESVECLGFFVYDNARNFKCASLRDLGVDSGVSTSLTSRSYTRLAAASTVSPMSTTVSSALTDYALDFSSGPGVAQPLRFSTAFDAMAVLDSFTSTIDACAEACNNSSACAGFFLYEVSSSRTDCRLLSDLGVGTATSTTSFSYRKML